MFRFKQNFRGVPCLSRARVCAGMAEETPSVASLPEPIGTCQEGRQHLDCATRLHNPGPVLRGFGVKLTDLMQEHLQDLARIGRLADANSGQERAHPPLS